MTLISSGDTVSVYYDGVLKSYLYEMCDGCYFMAIAYLQSNSEWDASSAYGEVVIVNLTVSNSQSHGHSKIIM